MLKYLIEKEFKQFARHPFMPKMAIIFPIMVMVILPMVVTMDVKNVKVCVIDLDGSSTSQQLIEKIAASTSFVMSAKAYSDQSALASIEYGNADIVVNIPDGFEHKLLFGEGVDLMISANATDATKAALGSNYLSAIVNEFAQRTIADHGGTLGTLTNVSALQMPVISQLNLFNPSMNYRTFMLPALIGMITIIIGTIFPALAVVTEKENGTLEQINVTPVKRRQFILSKLIPYWIIGIVALSLAFLFAWLVYGFEPIGSILTIYAASVLMTIAMSGLGLIISNYSNSFQQAIFMFFFIMIISLLMSGLFTPTTSMPAWARVFSNIMPPKYFMEIMRGVYLKGSGLKHLWRQFAWLGGFAIILSFWAIMSYRKRAD